MPTIANLVDTIIGATPILSEIDANGLITRVTDWRYIACAVLLVVSVIMVYHSMLTVVRLIAGGVRK